MIKQIGKAGYLFWEKLATSNQLLVTWSKKKLATGSQLH